MCSNTMSHLKLEPLVEPEVDIVTLKEHNKSNVCNATKQCHRATEFTFLGVQIALVDLNWSILKYFKSGKITYYIFKYLQIHSVYMFSVVIVYK